MISYKLTRVVYRAILIQVSFLKDIIHLHGGSLLNAVKLSEALGNFFFAKHSVIAYVEGFKDLGQFLLLIRALQLIRQVRHHCLLKLSL